MTVTDRDRLVAFVRETHVAAGGCDIVERAKAGRQISEKTAADYARVGRVRIDLESKIGGRLLEGVSRQSWDHHRAALRHEAARLFSYHRSACDKAQRAQDLQSAAHHAVRARRALIAFKAVSDAEKPVSRSAPRRSKRASLPRGQEWQLRAWEAATPAMRPAIAVGMVGARPQEIELGVDLRVISAKGQRYIQVMIQGAKVTDRSGQPARQLLIDPDTVEGRCLLAGIPEGRRRATIQRRAKRISLDWSQRIRSAMGGKVSAYSLRHQFAANLKSAGSDPLDVARALGHLSIQSQSRYGSKQQGQGRASPLVAVKADREIRTGPEADQVIDPDHRDPGI